MRNSRSTFYIALAATQILLRGLLGLAVALAVAMPAKADILPPASTLAHCTANNSFVDDPVSCTFGAFDTSFASLTLSPFVSLTAQAFSPPALEPRGASGTTDVTYSFQVAGGNVGDIVPLLIATTLTTLSTESDSAHSSAFAALTVHTGAIGTATLAAVCTDGSCGTTATSFSGVLITRARSGDLGDFLFLQVQAAASGTARLFAESASASGDPFLFVDPDFPNASLYSIVVSPGVGNAPAAPAAVPEPASVTLFALGVLFWAAPPSVVLRGRMTRHRVTRFTELR